MVTKARGGFHRFASGLVIAAGICRAGGLLMVTQAHAGGRDGQPVGADRTTPPAGGVVHVSAAPPNPASLE